MHTQRRFLLIQQGVDGDEESGVFPKAPASLCGSRISCATGSKTSTPRAPTRAARGRTNAAVSSRRTWSQNAIGMMANLPLSMFCPRSTVLAARDAPPPARRCSATSDRPCPANNTRSHCYLRRNASLEESRQRKPMEANAG